MVKNGSKDGNFISENSIFILDDFSSQKSNELISNLSEMVLHIPPAPIYQIGAHIESPYAPNPDGRPIIDVFINSCGGDGKILDSIVALLGIAKSKGAIIRTTVLGNASSCGSLLAIIGTHGYRIMYSQANHFIHFGTHRTSIKKAEEIELAAKHIQNESQNKINMYLQHTNLTAKELKKLQSNEFGYMTAQQCLSKGLCDWIITDFGDIIGRGQR